MADKAKATARAEADSQLGPVDPEQRLAADQAEAAAAALRAAEDDDLAPGLPRSFVTSSTYRVRQIEWNLKHLLKAVEGEPYEGRCTDLIARTSDLAHNVASKLAELERWFASPDENPTNFWTETEEAIGSIGNELLSFIARNDDLASIHATLDESLGEVGTVWALIANVQKRWYKNRRSMEEEPQPPENVERETTLAIQQQVSLDIVAAKLAQLSLVQRELQDAVGAARDLGVTWGRIGDVAGITSTTAYRRWDPEGQVKHRDYVRARRRAKRDGPIGESG